MLQNENHQSGETQTIVKVLVKRLFGVEKLWLQRRTERAGKKSHQKRFLASGETERRKFLGVVA